MGVGRGDLTPPPSPQSGEEKPPLFKGEVARRSRDGGDKLHRTEGIPSVSAARCQLPLQVRGAFGRTESSAPTSVYHTPYEIPQPLRSPYDQT